MRLVIFDDDDDLLFICNYYFSELGWNVEIFNNCENILNKLAAIMPDAILMDNWIPDIGGVAATQLIKKDELFKKTPVIYFSANNDIETLAKKAGADYLVKKPFQLEDLKNIILSSVNK